MIEDLVGDVIAAQDREDIASYLHPPSKVVNRKFHHFPAHNQAIARRSHVQRSCVVCAKKSNHHSKKYLGKTTVNHCKFCQVSLCIVDCFEVYRSEKNFEVTC